MYHAECTTFMKQNNFYLLSNIVTDKYNVLIESFKTILGAVKIYLNKSRLYGKSDIKISYHGTKN